MYNNMLISIHALVKRATTYMRFFLYRFDISIHALVKRATWAFRPEELRLFYFNPRPREEGDF